MYIAHSGTRTHALWGSVLAAERCQLPEIFERTEHHLSSLFSPHAPTPSFRPTGAASVYSLSHPNLNCSLSVVFLFDVFFPPTSFFFLPKVPLVAFDLKVQDSMQLLQVTSRFLWEIKMCSVPGTTVVMRPDNPSLGLRLKLDFLPDNVAIVAREECGHQVIDSVYMWWGGEVTISLSLCLHCLSLSPLSPLCHCLAFGQLCIWVQTDW